MSQAVFQYIDVFQYQSTHYVKEIVLLIVKISIKLWHLYMFEPDDTETQPFITIVSKVSKGW